MVDCIAELRRSAVDSPNQTSCLGIVVRPSRTSFDSVCRGVSSPTQLRPTTATRCRTRHGRENVTAFDFSLGWCGKVLVAVLALLSIQGKCFVTIPFLVCMHVVASKVMLANQSVCFADHHFSRRHGCPALPSRTLGYLAPICKHAFRSTVACRFPRWSVRSDTMFKIVYRRWLVLLTLDPTVSFPYCTLSLLDVTDTSQDEHTRY